MYLSIVGKNKMGEGQEATCKEMKKGGSKGPLEL